MIQCQPIRKDQSIVNLQKETIYTLNLKHPKNRRLKTSSILIKKHLLIKQRSYIYIWIKAINAAPQRGVKGTNKVNYGVATVKVVY